MYSFCLLASETPPFGLRRVMVEQIDQALWHLEHASDWGVAVHEVRKSCKRVRGVLRMVREGIGEEIYRRENAAFRDAARPLSPLRDTTVMVETIADLVGYFGHRLGEGVLDPIEHHLEERRRFAMGTGSDNEGFRTRTRTALEEARIRVAAWPVAARSPSMDQFGDPIEFITPDALTAAEVARSEDESASLVADAVPGRIIGEAFSDLGPGLEKTYRSGRRHMREACQNPTTERFHEWRKRVKYLRYQLEVLLPIWADVVDEHADAAAFLAEKLGQEHDLAELGEIIRSRPEIARSQRERSAILELIERRRADCRAEARALGDRVFTETPEQFVSRIEAYWNSWRVEATAPIP